MQDCSPLFKGRDDLFDDGIGVFGARIVRGDDDDVGVLSGDFTHRTSLGRIAITTAAKEHPKLTFFQTFAQRLQVFLERARRVRKVDDKISATSIEREIEHLHSTGNPGKARRVCRVSSRSFANSAETTYAADTKFSA